MTSETQRCGNVVTPLSDVPTKIQPKPNVVTTSCVSWIVPILTSTLVLLIAIKITVIIIFVINVQDFL